MNKIIKAINFCAEKHKGQERRETNLPYLIHPVIVSELVLKYKSSSKHVEVLRVAALLHDTLEDTETDFMEIQREFGPLVASLVLELTSDEAEITRLGKNEYLIQKMLEMSNYALFLKLVDRLSNISDAPRGKYLEKTRVMLNTITESDREITGTHVAVINDMYDIVDTVNVYPDDWMPESKDDFYIIRNSIIEHHIIHSGCSKQDAMDYGKEYNRYKTWDSANRMKK